MVNYSAVATVTWDDTDGRGQEGCVQRLAQISEPEQVNDKVEDGPKPTPPQPGIKLHNKRQESITGRVKRTDDAVLVVFFFFLLLPFSFANLKGQIQNTLPGKLKFLLWVTALIEFHLHVTDSRLRCMHLYIQTYGGGGSYSTIIQPRPVERGDFGERGGKFCHSNFMAHWSKMW